MAKSKIDAKEFMLQYGDRIGIGVAGFLALLLLVFACLGGGGDVSADDIKVSSKVAKDKIAQSVPDNDQIALKNEPVKTLAQIDVLAKSLTKYIGIDVLSLVYPFFDREPLRGKFRSNPRVYEPIEIAATTVDGAFKLYEMSGNSVMVVTTKEKGSKVKLPKNNAKQGTLGKGPAGAPPGNQPPPGGGLGGGRGGMGLGKPGASAPGQPPAKQATTTVTSIGAKEDELNVEWKTDVTPNDALGVSIMPLHAPYIVATFPYGKQVEEIAKALQLGSKSEVENYFKGLQVQRRQIIPKGGRLPDGKFAEADMVYVPNPANQAETILKPLAEVNNQERRPDLQYDLKQLEQSAGWVDVNNMNVARQISLAYSVAKSSNEGFYAEKNPIVEQLINYAGPRVALKLPSLVRNEYPELYKQLKIFMGAVDQIENDKKARIPKPPADPRTRNKEIKVDDPYGLFDENKPEQPPSKDPSTKTEPEANLTGEIPDYILLRFIDVDLRLGDLPSEVTYEYRLRVVLNNPNYKDEKNVADPVFAKKQYLTSDGWSQTARVTFQPDALTYSDERVRRPNSTIDTQMDKAPIQLQKWLSIVETVDKQMVPVGAWWVERLLVSRGEYIGKYPDLPGPAGVTNLVQWVSSAYDTVKQMVGGDVQKPTRTYNLETQNLLVDFNGGHFQSFRSTLKNRQVYEDIPCETLILEADGRLVSRYYSDDKNDEARKERFTQWDEWIKKLPKNEKKPAGSSNPGDKPGGGNIGS